MKRNPYFFLIAIILITLGAAKLNAQNAKWSRNGDNINSGEWLGTTNSEPLLLKSNNNLGIKIKSNGELIFKSLDLTGTSGPNGLVLTDGQGKILRFNFPGNDNSVLLGNGTWGTLPAAAALFTLSGSKLSLPQDSKLGIGTSNPTEALDVNGNTKISGDLKLTALSGTTGFAPLIVDNLGNVSKGIPSPPVNSCVPGNPQWSVGGDNFTPYAYTPPGGIATLINQGAVGTCNNYDFAVKSNGTNRAWFKTDGTISFGADIPSNSGGPEYKFHQGALRLSGFNTFGGPMVVFDGGINPYGDWGIEYAPTQFVKPGLNFWKPFGSPYAYNNIFFLADDGTIGMGTENPTSRLTLDAWGGDGLRVICSNNSPKAISLNLKTGNSTAEKFVVNGDGVTWIGNEVGSVGNSQLVVGQPNKNQKAISLVDNSNLGSILSYFNVYGDGKTEIRSLASTQTSDAFIIRDAANSDKINFKIKKNGYAYAREINVMPTNINFPDYVFSTNYNLMKLDDLEKYLKANNHLPNMPAAKEVAENGINVGDMQIKQMEKIEEAFLYILQLKKENEELKSRINKLEKSK